MTNIALFGAVFLFILAREMMCCQPLVEFDSWIHLWYKFKKGNIAAAILKQDSSVAQFSPVKFPLQAAPQPVGHASEKIVSFGG